MKVLLETIVASLDDAREAAGGGADRFELCSALALGGLSPSIGTVAAIKRELEVPVISMIRPREGGMAYSEGEYSTMLSDASFALEAGADGLVFGFLLPDGGVDVDRTARMVRLAEEASTPERRIQTVFHRAFDVAAHPDEALEQLIDLGVTRILTSGRASTAEKGTGEIRRLVERSDGRIEILPGGGITAENVGRIVAGSGVNQVHLYVTERRKDLSTASNPSISFAAHVPVGELEYRSVTESRVRRIRQLLDSIE
jgi:copper homeostasis protein